jgi:hypothetical protein
MAESVPQQTQRPKEADMNVWALGFVSLAVVLMMLLGFFHMVNGMSAIIDESFYTIRENFALEMDVTTWGWVHFIGGIVILIGSFGLLMGAFWARAIGVGFAMISIIWNFYSIPYYPIWSILMIVVAIGVIWALVVHGREFEVEM